MNQIRSTFLLSCVLLLACGSTPAVVDGDAGSSETDAAAPIDAGNDAAAAPIDAGHDAAAAPPDAGEPTLVLAAGSCFTLATSTSAPGNTSSCGDFLALMGARVDLQSGGSASTFCELPGTFGSLASVPTSYASCAWESYVEGGGDLAGHGLIVTNVAGTHHYRMRIASNALPDLVFSVAMID